MDFFKFFSGKHENSSFKKELKDMLGFKPGNYSLYKTALTHRSIREGADENNERLEYLGDAVLSTIVADFLFKRYPYKEEGFLTEMRSKMVNRQQLNDIAVRMGLKKITLFNKMDGSLKVSQIFGNTLEALVGALYLDLGYKKTAKWVLENIILPHMFMDDLEHLEINHKNKLYGWANKNGIVLEFETINERLENGRRLFTVAAVLDGKNMGEGKAFNKKDASQIAAQIAVEKMGIINSDS
ncbi:MAG TPA: ribonuclease III [Chitinophagaceae bacterium]|nr:ribonuclease III [Chitinophagaceae bacterium]HNA18712.1 ribonuclease III [Chitinophagaceae bacterium]HNA91025.1 ribonuclease III [Chitinophagaceae bacterium]HNA97506.1 ribonuclease III [Chitinophagaceae bacterium]HNF37477.1 ribonuclease III [Chitinophagaceae bacterium]